MDRKICVITGSRCEFGLLYWLMKAIQESAQLKLQIIATGMHLSHEFGLTYRDIEANGFYIDEKIEMLLSSDTAVGIAKSIGLGVIGFADAYERLKPDLVVILGDRFESLAAAQSAFIAKIPIAHIHGGELTMGAYDDGIRHSITKMSQLHFVSAKAYRDRVIQLGENPDFVFEVGACVLDSLYYLSPTPKRELEKIIGMPFNKRNIIITYHPETLSFNSSKEDMKTLLAALESLTDFNDTHFIFTKGNCDSQGRIMNDLIDEFCVKYATQAKAFLNLGHQNYLSLLKVVDMVVGNSSSAIIEAPYCGIPTVNIGERQKGRVRAPSIIDCICQKDEIIRAIEHGFSREHQEKTATMPIKQGKGDVASKILAIFSDLDLQALVQKQFYDLKI